MGLVPQEYDTYMRGGGGGGGADSSMKYCESRTFSGSAYFRAFSAGPKVRKNLMWVKNIIIIDQIELTGRYAN